jgi:2-phosphoglycerate kinase
MGCGMDGKGKVVILGGTPRSGKTLLSVMLAQNGYSWISLDHINEAIEKGLPEVSLDGSHDQESNAERLYRFFETLVGGVVADAEIYGVNTVIDMYDFTPRYVKKLPFQDKIEVYFLGYPDYNTEQIAYNIRHFAAPTDWIAQVDEDYLREVAERCHRVNQLLVRQCREYGYEFVNTGAGETRDKVLMELFRRITTAR